MKPVTILWAADDPAEEHDFRKLAQEKQMPYVFHKAVSVSSADALLNKEPIDIIITDLLFEKGGFADWLFLWPRPFILFADYKDYEKIDGIIKDEACDFLIREEGSKHLLVLPIMIKKVLSNRESLDRSNMHLRITERKYMDLVQALPDIVYLVDNEGRFTYINDSVKKLGYEPALLIGKHFSSILDEKCATLVSREHVLKEYAGKVTGPEKAPKLFDERRTGDRMTTNLEVRLRLGSDNAENAPMEGSVIAYGELSATGFSLSDFQNEQPGTVGIIRDITARKHAEKMLKESLAEKETLLREIHHRVKNNLQVISSLLNLQSEYLQHERDKQLFTDSQTQIYTMALVHEQLYQSERISKIFMDQYLHSLGDKLFDIYNVSAYQVAFEVDAKDIVLDIDTAIPLALLVSELISNSLKYAFPGNTRGKISVSLHKVDEKTCTMEVRDNGIGLGGDIDLGKSTTLGHKLVYSLSEQLMGTLEYSVNQGTCFRITFPCES